MRHPLHQASRVVAAAIQAPATGGGKAGALWRKLMMELFDPYRPELHYMRGPGPKWCERHGGATAR